ncbi:MAG: peptidylprolyl isomerase [Prevotellaceae bacterium]|jgi:peptidyl-prolyl cis-trans isomerase SurA|nr:peptidylprolyl isomerase [Prevotellaceae bacterium]
MRKPKKFILLALCFTFSTVTGQQNVLDKVLAVVGNEALLESDVEVELMQLRAQGQQVDGDVRCSVFEQLLLQKLLLTQAKLDSLKENDMMVMQEVEQRIRIITAQLGSTQELEKYFGKPLFRIKEEWTEQMRERSLTQQMQMNIVSAVLITPRDVEVFYKSLPRDSFPMVPDQYVIQQIAKYPPSGSEVRFQVRERLLELRERVMNGDNFRSLAVMYSEDLASARRGGELGMRLREELTKPFADAAFALKPGQVSQIVETEFGFHIIQMIEKRDEMANVRHILIRPTFSTETQQEASRLLDSVAALIRSDSISFERGVVLYSEDKNTRLSGGYVVNQQTLSIRFEKDQLIPNDYYVLRDMKEGELSTPFESKDNSGHDIFKIIKLKEFIPSHRANFEQDYMVIHDIAKNRKQQATFDAWVDKHVQSAYIFIEPDMCHCNFNRKEWVR